MGMSGGIDSALTACIAADALGSGAGHRRLHALALLQQPAPRPTPARRPSAWGCDFHEIPIETVFAAYLETSRAPLRGTRRPG